MIQVNDVMDDLEDEEKYIMVHGKPMLVKDIIDQLLKDSKNKRKLTWG